MCIGMYRYILLWLRRLSPEGCWPGLHGCADWRKRKSKRKLLHYLVFKFWGLGKYANNGDNWVSICAL